MIDPRPERARTAGATAVGTERVPLLEMHGIRKRFGDLQALDGVDLVVNEGEIHALVGENGSGKSTLLGIASGFLAPDEGTVEIAGARIGKGSRVVLRPATGRSDAQDMFLAGRVASVQAILFDADETPHLAVTLDDDPGADVQISHGRYRYFRIDEVEPLSDLEEAQP